MSPSGESMGTAGSFSLLVLRCAVGLVVLVQALLLALGPHAAAAFAQTGVHDAFRYLLAWGEAAAAVLFLVPATGRLDGWGLLVVFAAAAVLHLTRGQWNIGSLLVYAAAVVVTLGSVR